MGEVLTKGTVRIMESLSDPGTEEQPSECFRQKESFWIMFGQRTLFSQIGEKVTYQRRVADGTKAL